MANNRTASNPAAQPTDPVLRYTTLQRSIGHALWGTVLGAALGPVSLFFLVPPDEVAHYAGRLGVDLAGVNPAWAYAAVGAALGLIIEIPRRLARDARRRRQLARPQATSPVTAVEPPTTDSSAPGHADLRELVVTVADAQGFARQLPPRLVPERIALYKERIAPIGWLAIGACFGPGGLAFLLLMVRDILVNGPWTVAWLGAAFGLVFTAFGFPVMFLCLRARYRVNRLLRHGRMAIARIEKVEPTNESMNGLDIARLTVVYRPAGSEVRASCRIIGPALEEARKLAARSRPATILHDPAASQRILFVEGLISPGADART